MRFADKTEINSIGIDIGLAAISQFSSIRALSKMNDGLFIIVTPEDFKRSITHDS